MENFGSNKENARAPLSFPSKGGAPGVLFIWAKIFRGIVENPFNKITLPPIFDCITHLAGDRLGDQPEALAPNVSSCYNKRFIL